MSIPTSRQAINQDWIGALPASGRYIYPVAGIGDGAPRSSGVFFDFSSDCLPFREYASFLFRYIGIADEAPQGGEASPAARIPRFEVSWLNEASGPADVTGEKSADNGVSHRPENALPRQVVMRVDGREYFRSGHLGAVVANFESFFSSELASLAAEVFGYLHIHGTAVETSSGTIMIVEEQERGKTSMAMALIALGARPVSDDSLLMIPGEGRVLRVPRNFRYHSGTHEAIQKIRPLGPECSFYLGEDSARPAYHFFDPYRETGFEPGSAAPPCLILIPAFAGAGPEAALRPLRLGETLRTLIAQAMNPLDEELYARWFGPLEGVPRFRAEWGDLKKAAELVLEAAG